MTGRIGNFKAKCPRCGKTTFESPAGAKPKPEDKLTCTGCGHVVRHKDLVAQIGKEATKRVEKVLGDMLKGFNRRK
ncbi:MAG: hypothetical protein EPO27_10465 [Betaproteobacteria bacterium]|nr:MAG: hypothetical protein EPO27_10465 [Betaproteobacteria bacterium]